MTKKQEELGIKNTALVRYLYEHEKLVLELVQHFSRMTGLRELYIFRMIFDMGAEVLIQKLGKSS